MHTKKPKPGDRVILIGLPSYFVDDLPEEDQRAILRRVGKPIRLSGYDEDGRAQLEFREKKGTYHTIWVTPEFIRAVKSRSTGSPRADRTKR